MAGWPALAACLAAAAASAGAAVAPATHRSPRSLQATATGVPDACEVPEACLDAVPADLAQLCGGAALAPGRCYSVQTSAAFPAACDLRGPPGGPPAVLVPARSSVKSTLGDVGASISVRGHVQLTGLRLEAWSLRMGGAEVGVCPPRCTCSRDCAAAGGGILARHLFLMDEESNVSVTNACAETGGGVYAGNLTLTGRSSLHVANATANNSAQNGMAGGVYADDMRIDGQARVVIEGTTAQTDGGGFVVGRHGTVYLSGGASVTVTAAVAGTACDPNTGLVTGIGNGGGFRAAAVELRSGSRLEVTNASSCADGGGFYVDGPVTVTGASLLVRSAQVRISGSGGGFRAATMTLEEGSELRVLDAHCSNEGGGFNTVDGVTVDAGSMLEIVNVSAAKCAGFSVLWLSVSSSSSLMVNGSVASLWGGGFCSYGPVEVFYNATLHVANAWAGVTAAAFSIWGVLKNYAFGSKNVPPYFLISDDSSATFSDITADMGVAGYACNKVIVLTRSILSISGVSRSASGAAGSKAGSATACYISGRLLVDLNSTMRVDWDTSGDIMVAMQIVAVQRQSEMRIAGGPSMADTALATPTLRVTTGSRFTLAGFRGNTGLKVGPGYIGPEFGNYGAAQGVWNVQNGSVVEVTGSDAAIVLIALNVSVIDMNLTPPALAPPIGANFSRLRVTDSLGMVAQITGTGRAVVADVFMALSTACDVDGGSNCSAEVLDAPETPPLVQSVVVECPLWESGCAFVTAGDATCDRSGSISCSPGLPSRLQAVSGRQLRASCPAQASVQWGSTQWCACVSDREHSGHPVGLAPIVSLRAEAEYCARCRKNSRYDAAVYSCRPCPWYAPWSKEGSDLCMPFPGEGQEVTFLALFWPAVAFAALGVWMGVVVSSPMHITDMTYKRHTRLGCHGPTAGPEPSGWTPPATPTLKPGRRCCRRWRPRWPPPRGGLHTMKQDESVVACYGGSLFLTVQGPLADLHGLRVLLWRFLRYRVEGTGAYGVDYQCSRRNLYQLEAQCGHTVKLTGPGAELDRASSKGSLRVDRWRGPLAAALVPLAVVILLPTWLFVTLKQDEGCRLGHVAVTLAYMLGVLAIPACIIGHLWREIATAYFAGTPLTDLHRLYRMRVRPEPYQGPDADHPRHAGLSAGVLYDTYSHYKAVIGDRNMHYVVANIVLPLTKPERVSFATMWGGRTVMYFVSHSWDTVHSVFMRTIRKHARCSADEDWREQTYWICSFSNNQWDVSAALGETVMESAFARVLRSGHIHGVVMVLDEDVQPLHRVWCLFEVLVAHSEDLKIEYATCVGIIGDHRCASVDVPLAMANRVLNLRVEECQASVEEDRQKILHAIIERMGSLEAMDMHIGNLLGQCVSAAFAHSSHEVERIVGRLKGNAVPMRSPCLPDRSPARSSSEGQCLAQPTSVTRL